jgi:hypothetical protein
MLVADLDERARDLLQMMGMCGPRCLFHFHAPLCNYEGHSPLRSNILAFSKKRACLGGIHADSRRGSRALANVITWLVSLEEAPRQEMPKAKAEAPELEYSTVGRGF